MCSTSLLVLSGFSKLQSSATTGISSRRRRKLASTRNSAKSEGLLEDFTKPYGVVGGWRIEREDEEKEEWVLFSGFESVDNHIEFAKTKGFEKYREIMGFVSGFEVKHLRAFKAL
jgi:hypothetical protein